MLLLRVVVLLLALAAEGKKAPCDVYYGEKGEELCGPSILIVGVGKCGTNKVSRHIGYYYGDKVKTTRESEVRFDPYTYDVVSVVKNQNPGVKPGDDAVWMIKHPGTYNVEDPELLLGRLHEAFPSAVILMTICDPTVLDFRWFRHEMRWYEKMLPMVDTYFKNTLNSTLVDVYAEARPVQAYCSRPSKLLDQLELMKQHFVNNEVERPKQDVAAKNIGFKGVQEIDDIVWRIWPGSPVSSCTEGMLYGKRVLAMLDAVVASPFYDMGKNFGVVVMENWQDDLGSKDNAERIDSVLKPIIDGLANDFDEELLSSKEYAIQSDIENLLNTDTLWHILQKQYPPPYWQHAADTNCRILKAANIVADDWYSQDSTTC